MRLIEVFGPDAQCLKGPIRGYNHLYKIHVQGASQALRPLLCRGPFEMDAEFTVLMPAREINWDWDPPGAPEEAEKRRKEIAVDRSLRVVYEVPKP